MALATPAVEGKFYEELRKSIQKWSPGARDTISMIESTTWEDRTDAEKQEIIGALASSIMDDINNQFVSKFTTFIDSLEMTVLHKLKNEMIAIKDAVGAGAAAAGAGKGAGAGPKAPGTGAKAGGTPGAGAKAGGGG